MNPNGLRRRLARAIIIDRASTGRNSLVERVARERSEENYRFASRFVAGRTVLDVGGGAGIGHDLLLKADARSILSLDRFVAPTPPDGETRLRYEKGDFVAHPLPDAAFDTIICLGTIFYIPDATAALAKMRRLLRPGGTLVINCINQRLVRRYFGMRLEDVDAKFASAFEQDRFFAFLRDGFGADPETFMQQPVPTEASLGFWTAPLTWAVRRNPVVPTRPGAEGMFVYAVVKKVD